MAAGSSEARVSNLEELMIIIIIIVFGGGIIPRPGPVGDSFASDTTRFDALMRLVGRGPPRGDPMAPDISRMPAEAVESRLLEVNSELTRLRSHENELNARLKELRGSQAKSK